MESKNKKGVVVISVDVESPLGLKKWWSANKFKKLQKHLEKVQPHRTLFYIFDSKKIPVTWALVSSLSDKDRNINDLILCIKNSEVNHEIASHSYQHDDISEFNSPAEFEAQLSDIRKCENMNNLTPSVSYVFPFNNKGFIRKLKENGWEIYRKGTSRGSFRIGLGILEKFVRVLEYIFRLSPPVFNLGRDSEGMLVTEGSLCIISATGICRLIPCKSREVRAIKGIDRAIKEKKIVHLWFHDYVLFRNSDRMKETLKRIALYLDQKRKEGLVNIVTMSELL